MNIKKSGGKGVANEFELNQIIERDKTFIYEEIKIVDPDIIILGLSWESTVDLLFPSTTWKETGYYIGLTRFGNAKIIDFYHPSMRGSAVALYCLLEKIVMSKEFDSI